MQCYPLPAPSVSEFSTLLHLTRVNRAMKILWTRKIFGCDSDKQANFSVGRRRPDIARFREVLLTFQFTGQHAM